MDRIGARTARLIAFAIAAAALTAAAPGDAPLRAMRWTDSARLPSALIMQPAECLALPADPQARASVEIGRAAFRTPLILGGQAARLGLSCESCHTNARSNAAFFMPGLSGAPGTADVTSSMMSTHRGNGVFDPKPIPDLAQPGKIVRAADRPDLRNFIHGLVTEEFDGHEPPAAVLGGLVAYVRAIDAANCPATDSAPVTAELWIDAALRSMKAARERLRAHDAASALNMLDAARSALGMLDERYARLGADHARLLTADAEIARLRDDVLAGRAGATGRIGAWLQHARRWQDMLIRDEQASLFNAGRLNDAISKQR